MKRLLSIFTVTAVLAACNSDSSSDVANAKLEAYKDSVRKAADTAGLAQFQQWKAQNELANVAQYNTENAQAATPVKTIVVHTTAPKSTSSRSVSSRSGSMNSESANTAKAAQKKGWSKAAKGTAIGAGTGAVLGAVLNKKNRVVGGVVGGVLGGGVGYGIGRSKDKKDGRY